MLIFALTSGYLSVSLHVSKEFWQELVAIVGLDDQFEELFFMLCRLNAGADWTEHHGMIDAPTASAPLFYNATQASTTTGMKVGDSLFTISLHKDAAPLTTHPFLKLDTLELCKENPDAVLVRTRSSSMVDSSCNDDEINSTGVSVAVPSLLDRTLSLDDANFPVEADSPRGPLSPAALQLGKSPRVTGVKRQFDDLQTPPGVGYAPFATMASSPTFLPATPNVAVAPTPAPAPGLVFPAPLTLPTVPTLEEIAQSRPKRRNVRISKDPQSVAARHRRERISDRVRVLQHFVPGGTKMDTASMLDEAIQYVKFLQHQLQVRPPNRNSLAQNLITPQTPNDPLQSPRALYT